MSAEQGLVSSQTKLAICYQTGVGVQTDLSLAVHYYLLAAETDSVAYYQLRKLVFFTLL